MVLPVSSSLSLRLSIRDMVESTSEVEVTGAGAVEFPDEGGSRAASPPSSTLPSSASSSSDIPSSCPSNHMGWITPVDG